MYELPRYMYKHTRPSFVIRCFCSHQTSPTLLLRVQPKEQSTSPQTLSQNLRVPGPWLPPCPGRSEKPCLQASGGLPKIRAGLSVLWESSWGHVSTHRAAVDEGGFCSPKGVKVVALG